MANPYGLRSRGPAKIHSEVYAEARGIAPAVPTTRQEQQTRLKSRFETIKKGLGIYELYKFSNPSFDIQPGVLYDITNIKGLEITRESIESVLEKIQLPVEPHNESDPVFENLIRIPDTGADPYPNIGFEAKASNIRIHPQLYEDVAVDISTTTPLSEVPLYFFILTNFGHASILIYSSGMLYSIGLGLAAGSLASGLRISARNDLIANAHIYGPDFLITPNKGREKAGVFEPYKYHIIDIGVLQKRHLDRIQNVLNKATGNVSMNFEVTDAQERRSTDYFYKYSGASLELNLTYSYISSRTTSKMLGTFYNCISFAEDVFRERVGCPASAYASNIAHPGGCKSYIEENPDETFKQVMNRYIEGGAIGDLYDTLTGEKPKGALNTLWDCTLGICFRRKKTRKGGLRRAFGKGGMRHRASGKGGLRRTRKTRGKGRSRRV